MTENCHSVVAKLKWVKRGKVFLAFFGLFGHQTLIWLILKTTWWKQHEKYSSCCFKYKSYESLTAKKIDHISYWIWKIFKDFCFLGKRKELQYGKLSKKNNLGKEKSYNTT
jgi:hypothetical protein